MKATPARIAISFGVSLYFWAVLTASRNAARFFSGEFSVLSPHRHAGLVLICAILASILYFALRYALADRIERPRRSVPRLSLPTQKPAPRAIGAVAAPRQAYRAPLLPPSSLASKFRSGSDRGFVFPSAEGAPSLQAERKSYDYVLGLALKFVPPGRWVDLTRWSDGGTRSHLETLSMWYYDAKHLMELSRSKNP
jgi:hypothetical protein